MAVVRPAACQKPDSQTAGGAERVLRRASEPGRGWGGTEWERGVREGWWVTRQLCPGSGDVLVGQTGNLIARPRVASHLEHVSPRKIFSVLH